MNKISHQFNRIITTLKINKIFIGLDELFMKLRDVDEAAVANLKRKEHYFRV